MSFQAVGSEDAKERGPKLVMKDRGTSILCYVHVVLQFHRTLTMSVILN